MAKNIAGGNVAAVKKSASKKSAANNTAATGNTPAGDRKASQRTAAQAAHPSASALRKQATRTKILTAARRIFARHGFDAANVSDIVADIHMAQGTFYYHFPDKKSVLVEMIESFFSELRALTATWSRSVDTSDEAGARFARDLAALFSGNRDLVHIIIKESHCADPEVQKLISNLYKFLYDHAQMGLELGIRLGSVRPMDTRVAAIALIGMIEQVVAERAGGKAPVDIEHIAREIAHLQNYGIRPRPDGKPAPAPKIKPRRFPAAQHEEDALCQPLKSV